MVAGVTKENEHIFEPIEEVHIVAGNQMELTYYQRLDQKQQPLKLF